MTPRSFTRRTFALSILLSLVALLLVSAIRLAVIFPYTPEALVVADEPRAAGAIMPMALRIVELTRVAVGQGSADQDVSRLATLVLAPDRGGAAPDTAEAGARSDLPAIERVGNFVISFLPADIAETLQGKTYIGSGSQAGTEGTVEPGDEGYKQNQQRQIDQLIESTQGGTN